MDGNDIYWIEMRPSEDGRQVIVQQIFGVALRLGAGERIGDEGGDADIKQQGAAADPQPVAVIEQQVGDDGQAERRDDAEYRIGGCRVFPDRGRHGSVHYHDEQCHVHMVDDKHVALDTDQLECGHRHRRRTVHC